MKNKIKQIVLQEKFNSITHRLSEVTAISIDPILNEIQKNIRWNVRYSLENEIDIKRR